MQIKHFIVIGAVALLGSVATANGQEGKIEKIEIKGPVTEVSGTCPSLTFKIGQQTVRTRAATEFDDGTCADVQSGRLVEVEGTPDKDGAILAREVELE
jgi:hypothetical protein